MPTYDYRCKTCGHEHERFHGINAKPRVKCPECGAPCKKLMGTGSGVVFKGSGFYENDYKGKQAARDEAKRTNERMAEIDPNAPAMPED